MLEEGLDDLALLAHLVEQGSFSAASRALRIPKSSLSRRLDALEQRLGAPLMLRRAAGLSPTHEGRHLYERSRGPLRELSRAQQEVRQSQLGRGGLLRISAPPELSRVLIVPAVARLLRADAELSVEVELGPRPVDLQAEGFDAVVRSGRVEDLGLRARLLFRVDAVLVASPGYLRRRAPPEAPEELGGHACLRLTTTDGSAVSFLLHHPRLGSRTVSAPASVAVNDLESLRLAARDELGIALLPAPLVTADLAEGRLARVLPEWSGPARPYYLAYPAGRLPQRHRRLVDAILAEARGVQGARPPE
ncbi:MAG: LysR family transcriptional regulator [Polyangiaceae bacterium]